jgi:PIN domain nuclease of toxin-antitoxin system
MIVLDTHIWIRWIEGAQQALPAAITDLLERADSLAISAISCWEVAWLERRGRIRLKCASLDEWFDLSLAGSGVRCLALGREVAITAARLPEIHRDPADRFIIPLLLYTTASL